MDRHVRLWYSKIIQNIIRLEEIKAYDIMTPRVVAATAPEFMTLRDFYKVDKSYIYLPASHLPI